MIWAAVLLGSLGCYLIKQAGVSVPSRVLEDTRVSKVSALLPVALLASLITIQTFTSGHRLAFDARAAGLASAAVAQLLRAPFLVVVAVAATTTALLRLVA
jgi:hypothetical protein